MSTVHALAPALVLGLPLAAAIVNLFLERRAPKLASWIAVAGIGLAFLVAAGVVLPHAWKHETTPEVIADQIRAESPQVSWLDGGGWDAAKGAWRNVWKLGFHIDHLAAALLVMVTLCSTLIHVFSTGYMAADPRQGAFFRWIGFFTFAMLGLVVADNLFALYVCWELMGLSSYKLIGFWYHKPSAQAAAMKAFMVTRVGDVGMFLGILGLYATVGSLRYEDIFAHFHGVLPGDPLAQVAFWCSLGLFVGAMGKSAQFPLHVWLPDAMEGPTPVSALIHAATMVAAGVYLVGRMYPLFSVDPRSLVLVGVVGTFTALFAGTMAVAATDIKKVLAYSTVSQLGFMFAALGAGGPVGYYAGMFHLVTHAFFKACLFLGSGSVIHAVHTQEVGQMGGLWRKLPVTFWTWMAATLAIAGFPIVTAGFYSKDSILASLHMATGAYAPIRHACMWALVAGAFLTAAYMMRVTALTFFGRPREQERYDRAHESWSMTGPLVVLGLLALVGGFAWSEHFLRPTNLLGEWPEEAFHHAEGAVGLPAIAAGVGGLALGAFLYGFFSWESAPGAALRARLRGPLRPALLAWKAKYWMDEIYAATWVAASEGLSRLLARFDREAVDGLVNAAGRGAERASDASGWIDREVVDGQLVHGAAGAAWGAGGVFSRMQGGRVRVYAYQAVFTTAVLALVIAALYG